MKTRSTRIPFPLVLGLFLCVPGVETSAQTMHFTASKTEDNHVAISWNTVATRCYAVETNGTLMEPWAEYTVLTATNELLSLLVTVEPGTRFYRIAEYEPSPLGMALIPAGTFQMGDTFGEGASNELPVHPVTVSAFYMDRTEVTKALWNEVYQWAIDHGYQFDASGSAKAMNHPVQTVDWYDCVKWCNARSEKEERVPAYYTDEGLSGVYKTGRSAPYVRWDRGYRLPTEAEWEYAARGELSGKRFPWGDTISHSQANYISSSSYTYDVSRTSGYHPTYATGQRPYTSPVGLFAPNAYGLYDMTGNVAEWCWDWHLDVYYGSALSSDPRGPVSGSVRVVRGGNWSCVTAGCRVACRFSYSPDSRNQSNGFRAVFAQGQPGPQVLQIMQAPDDQSATVGDEVVFDVRVTGAGPITYQWQKDGTDLVDDGRITGSHSPALYIANAQRSDAGTYRVVMSNTAGSSTNTAATLTVNNAGQPPIGMARIPAGSFQMGDNFGEGNSNERPLHTVRVSAFYMDKKEVRKALWDEVLSWAIEHGYSFDCSGVAKGVDYPVHSVNWYDMVKWCNARSEKETRAPSYYTDTAKTTVYRTGQVDVQNDWVKWDKGYRLPTEAEWEYAARGGLSGRRFPWGDTISHSQANYYSYWLLGEPLCSYDVSPTSGYHPWYATGEMPQTSPVGSLATNAYGLYNMTGNVSEWCWDWYSSGYYESLPSSDPRGPFLGSDRVIRGGCWDDAAPRCRISMRLSSEPGNWNYYHGFRCVHPQDQQDSQAPQITQAPGNQSATVGDVVVFDVKVAGAEPITYQWQKDGTDLADDGRISGSRTSVLRIANAQHSDAGPYRVVISNAAGSVTSSVATLTVGPPVGMALILGGSFHMGDNLGDGDYGEQPVHTVLVSAFYMDRTEVTKALWDDVYQWAIDHGYQFDNLGSAKAANHPVQTVNWYDSVKWCNARSEMEGRMAVYYTNLATTAVYRTGKFDIANDWVRWNNGYRLPTEAEWEKAARGGLSGKRFPWGDTIHQAEANYFSYWTNGAPYYSYDVSLFSGYHPTYATGGEPYTNPVPSFGPNEYGLYDMAGNVDEWCWDRYSDMYYGSLPSSDPCGPASGSRRVIRGGSWFTYAGGCRVAERGYVEPDVRLNVIGFRAVLPAFQ